MKKLYIAIPVAIVLVIIITFAVKDEATYNRYDELRLLKVRTADNLISVQGRPFASGYLDLSPKGIIGDNTEAAVIAFMAVNGVSVDGFAGLVSSADLIIAMNNRPASNGRRKIFIGDSRTVYMSRFITGDYISEYQPMANINGDIWVRKGLMGYSWMVRVAVPMIERYIDDNTDVIILMGYNDAGTPAEDLYCGYINEKAAKWKELGAATYYVSAGPDGNDSYYDKRNDYIQAFNEKMISGLSPDVIYIDMYSELVKNYKTMDGVHYDCFTGARMYTIIMNNIK